jgi:mycothiol S-conjugate amidase
MVERGLEPQYTEWLKRWPADPPPRPYPVTRVPCAEYFQVRDDALLAHATQIDPDGPWFVIPREIQQKVWGTEDYELVTSHVESEIPEDDLFAGVTPGS